LSRLFPGLQKTVKKPQKSEPKIGAIQICLNEEQYIKASLSAVVKHKNVHKIAVVEGAVSLFSHAATPEGLSIDNTKNEVLEAMRLDSRGKIIFDRHGWAIDKSNLRNRGLQLIGKECDYILVVDADEVWKQEDLDRLVTGIKANVDTGVFWFGAYHFWKKPTMLTVGSQWDTHLFRCFNYSDKSLHWDRHEAPVVNQKGKSVELLYGSVVLRDVRFYHYGAMKEEKRIKDKLEYYKKRDTQLNVVNTWSNWRKGEPTQWTHGGGTVVEFDGTHPDEVREIISSGADMRGLSRIPENGHSIKHI
jgi:hypothetical protein